MRETLRVAEVDLAIRRFLGYGLTERLPHHATFSYAQCVRFASSSVFEQLFNQVLASCRDAGLLDGTRLIVDGTHVEANAALKSLRAELEVIDGDGEESEPSGASAEAFPDPRPRLELAAPRSGATPKRKASNATAVSRTDPDAKLRFKPGHRPHLVHRAQVATDPKNRVIVAVRAESALGHEADSLPVIIDRARWLRHKVRRSSLTPGTRPRAPTRCWMSVGLRRSSRRSRTCARPITDALRANAADCRSGWVPLLTGSRTARARSAR